MFSKNNPNSICNVIINENERDVDAIEIENYDIINIKSNNNKQITEKDKDVQNAILSVFD